MKPLRPFHTKLPQGTRRNGWNGPHTTPGVVSRTRLRWQTVGLSRSVGRLLYSPGTAPRTNGHRLRAPTSLLFPGLYPLASAAQEQAATQETASVARSAPQAGPLAAADALRLLGLCLLVWAALVDDNGQQRTAITATSARSTPSATSTPSSPPPPSMGTKASDAVASGTEASDTVASGTTAARSGLMEALELQDRLCDHFCSEPFVEVATKSRPRLVRIGAPALENSSVIRPRSIGITVFRKHTTLWGSDIIEGQQTYFARVQCPGPTAKWGPMLEADTPNKLTDKIILATGGSTASQVSAPQFYGFAYFKELGKKIHNFPKHTSPTTCFSCRATIKGRARYDEISLARICDSSGCRNRKRKVKEVDESGAWHFFLSTYSRRVLDVDPLHRTRTTEKGGDSIHSRNYFIWPNVPICQRNPSSISQKNAFARRPVL